MLIIVLLLLLGLAGFWELLEGVGLVGWGLFELIRQLVRGD